jgi:hypothetical protein
MEPLAVIAVVGNEVPGAEDQVVFRDSDFELGCAHVNFSTGGFDLCVDAPKKTFDLGKHGFSALGSLDADARVEQSVLPAM